MIAGEDKPLLDGERVPAEHRTECESCGCCHPYWTCPQCCEEYTEGALPEGRVLGEDLAWYVTCKCGARLALEPVP